MHLTWPQSRDPNLNSAFTRYIRFSVRLNSFSCYYRSSTPLMYIVFTSAISLACHSWPPSAYVTRVLTISRLLCVCVRVLFFFNSLNVHSFIRLKYTTIAKNCPLTIYANHFNTSLVYPSIYSFSILQARTQLKKL